MKLATLARTIRHLRPSQLAHLALNRIRVRFSGPPAPAENRAGDALDKIGWTPGEFPEPLHASSEELLAGRFEFVGETHDVGFPPADWSPPQATRLWAYNLHYFDWLWSLPPDVAERAVDDWIARHPPQRGSAGWEPYPLSLRLMNWAGFFCARHRDFLEAPPQEEFRERLFASMDRQAICLLRSPEKHLLANHYLENGAALALMGACFAGQSAAQTWWSAGLQILDEQLPEQCPADGLHFERSPMYHLRLVYLIEVLMASGDPQLRERAEPTLQRALAALGHVLHPDGDIALLADSALGIYPTPPMPALSTGAFALPDAGYYGYRSENGDYIVCDFGEPSPAYNPGHAHAGLFSFEASVAGQRLISDTGAATYRPGEERSWARSTAAHSTVELDGEDQAEMWGAFRIGRRPRIHQLQWTPTAEGGGAGFVIEAEHDGYRFGNNPRCHWRRISYDAETRRLRIEDRIEAEKMPTRGRIAFHFAPNIDVRPAGELRAELQCGGRTLATIGFGGDGEAGDSTVGVDQASTTVFRHFHRPETRATLIAGARGQGFSSRCEICFSSVDCL